MRTLPCTLLCSFGALALVGAAAPIAATTWIITTVDDDLANNGNCTLREALEAAVGNVPVDACPAGSLVTMDTIELAAGIYSLPLGVLDAGSCGELTLRGPAVEPPTATISGGSAHRVLTATGGCDLTLEGLEIRDGRDLGTDTPIGAGVRIVESSLTVRRSRFVGNVARRGGAIGWASVGAARRLIIENSVFEANRAERPDNADSCQGGGLWANAVSGAEVRIADSRFEGNEAEVVLASDFARGGGADINAEGSGSSVTLERVRFLANQAASMGTGGFATAGGFYLYALGATVRLEDLEVVGNSVVAANPMGGTGAAMIAFSSANAALDRLAVVGNTAEAPVDQLQLSVQSSAFLSLRDSLVAQGEGGLLVSSFSEGVALISQITVTDHTAVGLELDESGTGSISLVNSIAFGNGTDLGTQGTPAIFPTNLVGIDPLFEDAAGGDYRLAAGSPAEDAADISFSGLGPYDLAHGARLLGTETDLGAFERGALFNDGFEIESTANWSW